MTLKCKCNVVQPVTDCNDLVDHFCLLYYLVRSSTQVYSLVWTIGRSTLSGKCKLYGYQSAHQTYRVHVVQVIWHSNVWKHTTERLRASGPWQMERRWNLTWKKMPKAAPLVAKVVNVKSWGIWSVISVVWLIVSKFVHSSWLMTTSFYWGTLVALTHWNFGLSKEGSQGKGHPIPHQRYSFASWKVFSWSVFLFWKIAWCVAKHRLDCPWSILTNVFCDRPAARQKCPRQEAMCRGHRHWGRAGGGPQSPGSTVFFHVSCPRPWVFATHGR